LVALKISLKHANIFELNVTKEYNIAIEGEKTLREHTCTNKNCQLWEIVNFDKYALRCLNVLSAGSICSVMMNDSLYSEENKIRKTYGHI
jgi:hypothetical protein